MRLIDAVLQVADAGTAASSGDVMARIAALAPDVDAAAFGVFDGEYAIVVAAGGAFLVGTPTRTVHHHAGDVQRVDAWKHGVRWRVQCLHVEGTTTVDLIPGEYARRVAAAF